MGDKILVAIALLEWGLFLFFTLGTEIYLKWFDKL
jgi:hypothetical protein